MNKLKIKKGFTLVELIIVITILVILATISFVSFNGYTKTARDSARITTIKNISKGIDSFFIKTGKVPNVDNQSSTGYIGGETLTYVGNIGENITSIIGMGEIPKDPLTGNNYVYGIDVNKKKYQIGGVMEDGIVSKVEGNYNGLLKNGGKIYNLPSLIFTGSGNLLSDETRYIIEGGKNIAYSIDNKELNNTETGGTTLKILTNNQNANTITGITIPTSLTGYTLSGTEYSSILGYNVDTIGITLFPKDYIIAKENNSNNGTGVSGPINPGVYSNMPINMTLSPTLSKGTLSNGNLKNDPLKYSPGMGGIADIAMNTGKRFWELTLGYQSQNAFGIGISNTNDTTTYSDFFYTSDKSILYYGNGNLFKSGNIESYGSGFTTGDIIGVLFDADSKTIEFFKNGVSQGVKAIGISGSSFYPINANGSSDFGNEVTYNFGATAFAYVGNATEINGNCGISNGTTVESMPNTNLCIRGNSVNTDILGTDGTFNWSCNGENGGTNASCSANKSMLGAYGNMPTNTTLSSTYSKGTLGNGNLTSYPGTWNSNYGVGGFADIPMTTGNRYWEVTCGTTSQNAYAIGITNTKDTLINILETSDKSVMYYGNNGNIFKSGTSTAYGNGFTTGDVIGVLFDADAKTIKFFKNGVSQGVQPIGISGTTFYPINVNGSSGNGNDVTYNFGASSFLYTP